MLGFIKVKTNSLIAQWLALLVNKQILGSFACPWALDHIMFPKPSVTILLFDLFMSGFWPIGSQLLVLRSGRWGTFQNWSTRCRLYRQKLPHCLHSWLSYRSVFLELVYFLLYFLLCCWAISFPFHLFPEGLRRAYQPEQWIEVPSSSHGATGTSERW